MQIKFLKAGKGDSILIHHANNNILIDGGNDSQYLLAEVDKIYEMGQIINLLIITHHDDDHIKGIIELLELVGRGKYGDERQFIEKVIFNSPKLISENGTVAEEKTLSYKQAHIVDMHLFKLGIERQVYTDTSLPIEFDGLTLHFLSPQEDDLNKYSHGKGAYLTSDFKCDWKSPMSLLDKFINDKSQDQTVANSTSIVIVAESFGKKVLLTGDITPQRLESILNKLALENNGPIYFDYIKLPHHASYRSLNKNIIENVICKNYIVSTDSTKYFLPNKRALLKILKFSNRATKEFINFHFNYEEAIFKLEITEKEKIDYSFNLIKNNKPYGVSI